MITVQQFLDAIKREAKLEGSTDLDQLIIDKTNDILQEYTKTMQYQEMFKIDTPLTCVAATSVVPLPADYAYINDTIRYVNAAGEVKPLTKLRVSHYPETGTPETYRMSYGQISLYPFSAIATGDTILIDYYALAPTITNDSDPVTGLPSNLPFQTFYVKVKNEVLARLALYQHDLEKFKALEQESQEIQFPTDKVTPITKPKDPNGGQ